MSLNPVSNEPVLTSVVASVLVWVGARYAVKVDPQQASEAAGVVLLIAGAFTRQLVRPTAKDQPAKITLERPDEPLYEPPPASPGPSKVGQVYDQTKKP